MTSQPSKFNRIIKYAPGPEDHVLKEYLFEYARLGLSLDNRVTALAKDLGYSIG